MRVSEKWGGDVDAAVELALKELKLTMMKSMSKFWKNPPKVSSA